LIVASSSLQFTKCTFVSSKPWSWILSWCNLHLGCHKHLNKNLVLFTMWVLAWMSHWCSCTQKKLCFAMEFSKEQKCHIDVNLQKIHWNENPIYWTTTRWSNTHCSNKANLNISPFTLIVVPSLKSKQHMASKFNFLCIFQICKPWFRFIAHFTRIVEYTTCYRYPFCSINFGIEMPPNPPLVF